MYKLKVSVERIDGYCNQPMLVGDHFFVEGGKITIPADKHVCMWALQSMMPIFPLMQREMGISAGIMTAYLAGGWVAQNIGWREAFFVVTKQGCGRQDRH